MYEQYSRVSHTALVMARSQTGRSGQFDVLCGHPQHNGDVSHCLTANGQAGTGGTAGSSCGGHWWRFLRPLTVWQTVVCVLGANVRFVRRAAKNAVRNFLLMDRRKSASLCALVLQTSVLALTIRYSRTEVVTGPRYLTSTAVVMSELVKLVVCLYMVFFSASRRSWRESWAELLDVGEAARTAVPSGLYTLQNNLQFVAVSYLDAATFQVTYQLRILTTAVFSVLFLQRRLDSMRWFALVLLTTGVALVQFPNTDDDNDVTGSVSAGPASHTVVGLLAVLVMCFSSGFAGVYFEKVIKSSSQSLWAKNVQMAFFSVLLGLGAVAYRDWRGVAERGFFQGYNVVTIVVILQHALLGLIISLVMKYADNILKGFASAISIILTSFISSVFLHDLHPSCSFLIGSIIVMGSVLLYNVDRRHVQKQLEDAAVV